MTETYLLFEFIVNSIFFSNTTIMLFLNKIDLLKEKLATTKLGDFFDKYKGANDYESVMAYFDHSFRRIDKAVNRQLVIYQTCKIEFIVGATDTKMVSVVMASVTHTLFDQAMGAIGME